MKFGKYIIVVSLFIASCTDFGDINVDPDVSPSANPKEVLTSAQGYMAWVLDGQLNERGALWAQYWTWGPGVALGNDERYIAEPGNFNNVWGRAYSNALADLKFLVNSGDPSYTGIAKVLQASTYQLLVDHFGDVPYSEAINGALVDGANFAPKFDDDKFIYAELVKLLDNAVSDLSKGTTNPGAADLMYGGDLSKWIKYANSLKLRLLMRQSITGDQAAIGAAVRSTIAKGNFIMSPADIAKIDFAGAAGSENPMYASFEVSLGNFFVASNSSLNVLRNDPRLEKFYIIAENSGTFEGVDQGGIDALPFTVVTKDFSQATTAGYGNTNPVIFMSDWEVWFLRSEAALRYNTGESDETNFAQAIASSFAYLKAEGADAFSSGLEYGTKDFNGKIALLATQKWISFNGFQEAEGWAEARRLDTPDTKIFTGVNGLWKTPLKTALGPNVFPTIYLYPESEISFNPNAKQKELKLLEKTFWDN